jgi:transposase
MKEDIAKAIGGQTAATLDKAKCWSRYGGFIGLDVHEDTIAVVIAKAGRDEPVYRVEVANAPKAIGKWLDRLSTEFDGALLVLCYLLGAGHACQVVARSLIPKKPGERIKTDRRDALKLARLLRAGDLTAVWVPDAEQEAMRDLTRTRDDMKSQERKARQQLNAFCYATVTTGQGVRHAGRRPISTGWNRFVSISRGSKSYCRNTSMP